MDLLSNFQTLLSQNRHKNMTTIELTGDEKAYVRKSCNAMYNKKEFADTLLVLKDGEVMAVNRLAVGMLFPYLATSLELRFCQDPMIMLPDYDKDHVRDLLKKLLDDESYGEILDDSKTENDFDFYSDMFVEEHNGKGENNSQNGSKSKSKGKYLDNVSFTIKKTDERSFNTQVGRKYSCEDNKNIIALVEETPFEEDIVDETHLKIESDSYNANTDRRKRPRKEVNYYEEGTDYTKKTILNTKQIEHFDRKVEDLEERKLQNKRFRKMVNNNEDKIKDNEEEIRNSKRTKRPRKQINYSEEEFESKKQKEKSINDYKGKNENLEDNKKNIILLKNTDQSVDFKEVCDNDDSALRNKSDPKANDINEEFQNTPVINQEDFHDLYSLEEFITYTGEFGMLHTAVRKSDQCPVVVKEVKKENAEMTEDNSIPLEAFLWQKLNNIPAIIQLINYYESNGSYYYVMERPENSKDLATFMEDWKEKTSGSLLPETLFKKIFVEIVKTVLQCHDEGVVHGDIKDENILIDIKTATIKLSDLNSAMPLHNGTYDTYTGTAAYAPPEWTQEGRYTADGLAVWSLGVLLHTMACGNSPFQTEEQAKRVALILPKLSPELRNLISCCLKSSPKDRIKLRDILNHKWAAR